ncbi:hypothetical protein BKA70DRAFT_721415 [Coprinopsis sp. MPI-PUGE-AT-0042]|nr:hypothetical protein BKA70DRAFT_721415 [Coprinopsis sp. MPI-PUGE-AT-0042]
MISLSSRDLPLVFGALLMYTSLISLHLYLCIHGFVKYRHSTLSLRQKHRNYVLVMFLVLVFSLGTFSLDLASVFVSIDSQGTGASVRVPMWLEATKDTFIGCTHLTADGLLVWRCYVIWTGRRWIGLSPVVPYVTSMVFGILTILRNVVCVDEPTASPPIRGLCKTSNIGLLQLGVYYLFATSVNMLATTLICVRLLRMKRLVDKISASSTTERMGGSPYSRVTMILMESALPFTVLGILSAVFALVDTDRARHARIFTGRLWYTASGLTAQVITYRVITGVSWTSSSGVQGNEEALSRPIHFAHSAPLSRSESSRTLHDLA